ncbi:unnamed protein product [Musa acuminata subsp. burmannicoides]
MAWLRSLPRFDSSPPSPAPGAQKPRVVVLGTGWAGCRLMKGIDTRLYDVVCISPNEYEVAEREGKFLARLLNGIAKAGGGYAANIKTW